MLPWKCLPLIEMCCVAEAVSALTYLVDNPHSFAHQWSLSAGACHCVCRGFLWPLEHAPPPATWDWLGEWVPWETTLNQWWIDLVNKHYFSSPLRLDNSKVYSIKSQLPEQQLPWTPITQTAFCSWTFSVVTSFPFLLCFTSLYLYWCLQGSPSNKQEFIWVTLK